jgi:disulfide bond formation protein DsbB
MTRLSPPSLGVIAAFLGSGSLLAGAYAFQYLGGLQPCHLCLWQRWPHWALVLLGLAGFFTLTRKMVSTTRLLLLACAAAAATSAGLALYHAGVEQKWWLGPQGCTARPITGDIADIQSSIIAMPFVQCDAIPWQLFGVSMAGYNFLFSLLLLGVFLWSLRKAYDASDAY